MQDIYTTFEFFRIKEALSEFAKSEVAKENIENLSMLDSFDKVKDALDDLNEVYGIIARFGPFPISNSANALYLIQLAKKTGLLTPRDLNLIAEDVKTSKSILEYFKKINLSFPRVDKKIANFFDLSNLEKEIRRVITNSLTVADNATPTLNEIRHNIHKYESLLQDKIAHLAFSYSPYLNDDNATIRDGHFVLPVKTTEKSKVLGIVYDVSSSGGTTFIEPMEIVEINNKLTSLKVEENEEVRKILKQLTALILLQEGEIVNNNSIIGELDFLCAKSLYALANNGEIAELSKEPFIEIVSARHPLIDSSRVVSNSYYLDKEKYIVIISGPNAGGKTVSLKTVGLLVLMNQCGLAIPCVRAKLSYFNNIYIDIGDNQSLSDNLSTFSAHMNQISQISSVAREKDLVLLDELGTGTDPREGEAIALAVVKHLEKNKVFAMVSSHFDALKEYAFLSKNLENSSMIFDEDKLVPTYKFKLGTPGHSYALSVASRYGLDASIIEEAKQYLNSTTSGDTSELLDILQQKATEANKLEEEMIKAKKDLDNRIKKLENDENLLKGRRETLLKDVENEKKQIIDKAREEIDFIMSSLNKEGIKLHEVIDLKRNLDDLETSPETIIYNEEINIGDYVSIPSLSINGKVSRIKGSKAHIDSDSGMSFDVAIDKLHKLDKAPEKTKRNTKNYENLINTNVGLECNIIGMHVDEAQPAIEKYIDNCRLKHLQHVRIIHGFGSGTLRKLTQDYLSKQKDLTFRNGDMHEGGAGATVIDFKK